MLFWDIYLRKFLLLTKRVCGRIETFSMSGYQYLLCQLWHIHFHLWFHEWMCIQNDNSPAVHVFGQHYGHLLLKTSIVTHTSSSTEHKKPSVELLRLVSSNFYLDIKGEHMQIDMVYCYRCCCYVLWLFVQAALKWNKRFYV